MTRSRSGGSVSNTSPLRQGSVPPRSTRQERTTSGRQSSVRNATADRGPSISRSDLSGSSVTVTDATRKKDLKRRAGYKSKTTPLCEMVAATAETAIDDAADKPVFNETSTLVDRKKKLRFYQVSEKFEKRYRERKEPREVFEELYWFLLFEFMFVPRTADLLRQMRAKAKQFFALHDMNGIPLARLYQMTVSTISRVMDVTQDEREAREALKNKVAGVERMKHAKLVTTGNAGNSGWGPFKRTCQLPVTAK